MVKQTHRQMVFDKVLSTAAEVHGVPVQELIPHDLYLIWSDLAFVLFAQKHRVKEIITQVFCFDLQGARHWPLHVLLQVMGYGVVGHIYRGVWQGLNEVLFVPGQFGAQAEGSAATPLFEPVYSFLQIFGYVGVVPVEVLAREMLRNMLFPLLVSVRNVPLVA